MHGYGIYVKAKPATEAISEICLSVVTVGQLLCQLLGSQ